MDQQLRQRAPGRVALLAGLALVAVAAAVLALARGDGNDGVTLAESAPDGNAAPQGARVVPAIDADQPTTTETATFGMG